MRVKIWGARGSLPSPGADMVRYGGNTSCVQVTLSDGTQLILDAGTGIRNLPGDLGSSGDRIHILLSHLTWTTSRGCSSSRRCSGRRRR